MNVASPKISSLTHEEEPLLPPFLVYFFLLSMLISTVSTISLDGPICLGLAFLPRASHGINTPMIKRGSLLATCLARLGVGLYGLFQTGILLVAEWPRFELTLVNSGHYAGAPLMLINLVLACMVCIASIFIIENGQKLLAETLSLIPKRAD